MGANEICLPHIFIQANILLLAIATSFLLKVNLMEQTSTSWKQNTTKVNPQIFYIIHIASKFKNNVQIPLASQTRCIKQTKKPRKVKWSAPYAQVTSKQC